MSFSILKSFIENSSVRADTSMLAITNFCQLYKKHLRNCKIQNGTKVNGGVIQLWISISTTHVFFCDTHLSWQDDTNRAALHSYLDTLPDGFGVSRWGGDHGVAKSEYGFPVLYSCHLCWTVSLSISHHAKNETPQNHWTYFWRFVSPLGLWVSYPETSKLMHWNSVLTIGLAFVTSPPEIKIFFTQWSKEGLFCLTLCDKTPKIGNAIWIILTTK